LEDERAWRELGTLSAFHALSRSTPFTEVASAPCEGDCANAISEVFAEQPAAFWIDALRDTSVGIGRSRSIGDIERDPLIRAAGLIVKREHPGIGMVDHIGVGVRLSATPMQVGRPTPVFGADTEAVLAGAGYTDGEITALRNEGVVALGKFV
jgi:crotonobetainyl-CoA:carnitine CoA-transferase CaiB-like acyl-CoA transferase